MQRGFGILFESKMQDYFFSESEPSNESGSYQFVPAF
jgi:hypothetical protein